MVFWYPCNVKYLKWKDKSKASNRAEVICLKALPEGLLCFEMLFRLNPQVSEIRKPYSREPITLPHRKRPSKVLRTNTTEIGWDIQNLQTGTEISGSETERDPDAYERRLVVISPFDRTPYRPREPFTYAEGDPRDPKQYNRPLYVVLRHDRPCIKGNRRR